MKMSSYPDENFKISEPAVEKLSARIERAITGRKFRFFDVVLRVKVIEKEGGESEVEWARRRLTDEQMKEFKLFIQPVVAASSLSDSTTINNG